MEFKKKLLKKIFSIIKKKPYKVIAIDGITCSGKTTFAKFLKSELEQKKIKTILISKDLFLKPRLNRIKILRTLSNNKLIDQNSAHYDLAKFKKFINTLFIKQDNSSNIRLDNLYNRKTGINDKTLNFKAKDKDNVLFIVEGIYILKELPISFKSTLKILLFSDIYRSLSLKLERIRDNSITLEDVIGEYKNIHLKSYYKYLKKHLNFDLTIDNYNMKFSKKKLMIYQLGLIKNFLYKH